MTSIYLVLWQLKLFKKQCNDLFSNLDYRKGMQTKTDKAPSMNLTQEERTDAMEENIGSIEIQKTPGTPGTPGIPNTNISSKNFIKSKEE